MPKKSAGIILYRFQNNQPEIFLLHPGGPFWAKKDAGSWSIPKGEFAEDEEALSAAKRELEEETGIKAEGNFIELTPVKQKSGKTIYAWALEMEVDPEKIISNTIFIEWPPRTGFQLEIPEVDRGAWFNVEAALSKVVQGQASILRELFRKLAYGTNIQKK